MLSSSVRLKDSPTAEAPSQTKKLSVSRALLFKKDKENVWTHVFRFIESFIFIIEKYLVSVFFEQLPLEMYPRGRCRMYRVLSVLVENEPGVLSRVAGLFSGRGFNIESLNVAPHLESGLSHMTITTSGDAQIIEQIVKQLRKLITVVKVVDYAETVTVEREMMLVKVQADDAKRGEILRLADIFRCKVVDVSLSELTLEVTGNHEKLQAVLEILAKFGIRDMARTGTVALRRSMQPDP